MAATTTSTASMNDQERGDLQKLAEKVEKLLALSQSSNEHEAAAAAARVQDLLQKYNLEIADIEALRGEKVEHSSIHLVRVPFVGMNGKAWNQRTTWEVNLATVIATNFFCRVVFSQRDVVFVGTEANLQTGTYVYAQLVARLWALSAQARNTYVRTTKQEYEARGAILNWNYETNKMGKYDPYFLKGSDHPNAYRRSWLDGAVMGVSSKLYEQRRAFEEASAGKGTALALNHNERNEAWMMENLWGGKRPKGFTQRDRATNYGARTKGYEEGYNINIHAGLGGASGDAPALKETRRLKG
jgi:ElaB/YqjD/DUF883 family membrane-anchored ribosome-binding protein